MNRLTKPRTKRRGALLAALALAAVGALSAGLVIVESGKGASRASAESPAATSSASSLTAVAPPSAATPDASSVTQPLPSPSASTSRYAVPVVAVEGFWLAPASIDLMALGEFWSGGASRLSSQSPGGPTFSSLAVSSSAVAGLSTFFGRKPAASVRVLTSDEAKASVHADAGALALISAADLTPDVRALALDGVSLFGSGRTTDPGSWRLKIASSTPWAGATNGIWTLAAGGDINLDRRIYVQAITQHRGADYPWDGGTARVAGTSCCGWLGAGLVVARSTGNAGAFRSRFADADLALLNFEGSAPNDYEYRPNSLVFTFDPELLAGLKDAGIDMVSLANNHIRNGGDQGVLDTCTNLSNAGVAHVGAGANAAAAKAPGWLSADGLKVAVLAYSAVGVANWATSGHPGAAALRPDDVVADIHAAKAAGADVVIVMPHWGTEYSFQVSPAQKREAAQFVAAGADLVLGSHSHWVGGIQSMPGPNGPAFVDYSMGDLMFDLNHDTNALEAEIVTLSFVGKQLVQVQFDPTVMVEGAQVGLLNPATDGKNVINSIRAASRNMLDW